MSRTHDEIRAVRVMVDELRAEQPPALDWSAMEQRLLGHIAARPAASRVREQGSTLARVLGFAAAAAFMALGVGSMANSSALPGAAAPAPHLVEVATIARALGEPGARGAHDLGALREGDVIEAKDAPVSFGAPGLVTWTIAPGSAVRVRSSGARLGHTVALERGELRAEVTPRDPAEGLVEAFAVEVAGTRVAVHGTAFSVKVDGAHAIVDVEHGAVAVGPVGYAGATTGHLLVGPSRASFSLDGGRAARLLPRDSAPIAAPVVAVAAIAPALEGPRPGSARAAMEERPAEPANPIVVKPTLAAHPAAKPTAEAAAPPSAEPETPRLTVAVVRARLERCFQKSHASGSSTVEVSVSSTLHIDVNPDGSVRARFDPPLKPEVQDCAGSAIAGRFTPGAGPFDIPITYTP